MRAALVFVIPLVGCSPATEDVPTYYADIRPILDTHCVRCHTDGGLGVGDFTDDALVDAFAEVMLQRIEAGEMPPPVSDPTCHDYVGSDILSVPQESRDVFRRWLEAGRPLGDPADDPGIVVGEVDLTDADLTLTMPEPYTPTFSDPDNPGNEYRCFLIDPGTTPIRVSAMDPVVGTPPLVHHVVLFGLDRSDVTDAMRDPQGWDCIDDMDGDLMFAAWAPGMLPIELPDGHAMTLGGDQVLILQMHYFQATPDLAGTADRSGYAFRTVSEPSQEVYMVPLGLFDFAIPPGEEAYTDSGLFDNPAHLDLEIHGVFPHMHRLGVSYDMRILHEDGTETCLVNGRYDFNNQLTYQFSGDLPRIGAADRLSLSCTWNNSSSNDAIDGEPVLTAYGERTDEEMCFFFTLVSLAD